jgi:hypothetical protein
MIFALPQKDELLRNTKSPRIIFIGGSNLSFGLNSQMIKDSLNINPINTSLNAELGLKFMLRHDLKFIRENDIVIISPEYQQFYGEMADGGELLIPIIIDVLHQTKDCDNLQLLKLMKYIPKYAYAKLQFWNYFIKSNTTKIDIFDKKSFNEYGDVYIHWNMPKEKNIMPQNVAGKLNTDMFQVLDDFRKKLINKKTKLYITFPCYQSSSYKICIVQIKEIENILKKMGFSFLGSPERYKMNDSLMFNSPYHLIKRGVDYRTELLIEDIKNTVLK